METNIQLNPKRRPLKAVLFDFDGTSCSKERVIRRLLGSSGLAGCILKPNELEGAAAAGMDSPIASSSMRRSSEVAMKLARLAGSSICGAGDTFLSAFACALAAGAGLCEAAAIANLAPIRECVQQEKRHGESGFHRLRRHAGRRHGPGHTRGIHAVEKYDLDRQACYVIGDRWTDMLAPFISKELFNAAEWIVSQKLCN